MHKFLLSCATKLTWQHISSSHWLHLHSFTLINEAYVNLCTTFFFFLINIYLAAWGLSYRTQDLHHVMGALLLQCTNSLVVALRLSGCGLQA